MSGVCMHVYTCVTQECAVVLCACGMHVLVYVGAYLYACTGDSDVWVSACICAGARVTHVVGCVCV